MRTALKNQINVWPVASGSKLTAGSLVRMPDHRVFVVSYVGFSRARVYPLTPRTRTIVVPSATNPRTKEVNETGDPIDISPGSVLPTVKFDELTDTEFARLTAYIESGGEFNE